MNKKTTLDQQIKYYMEKYGDRYWQAESHIKRRGMKDGSNELISEPAGVGTGKSKNGFDSIGHSITDHINEPTFDMIIAPTRRLCVQHKKDLVKELAKNFNLKEKDYNLEIINCDNHHYNRKKIESFQGHKIFVFCDKSLWRTEELPKDGSKINFDPNAVWKNWIKTFKFWKEKGVHFGTCFVDEAHNYSKQYKKIFNPQNIMEHGNLETLNDFFDYTILATGTPRKWQIDLETILPNENIWPCPLYVAVKEKYVNEPILHLVHASSEENYANGVIAVIEKAIEDQKKKPLLPSVTIINHEAIGEAEQFNKLDWINKRMGKDFHVIKTHTKKECLDSDGTPITVVSSIDGGKLKKADGTEYTEQEIANVIQTDLDNVYKIDVDIFKDPKTGKWDGLPIVIQQISQIAEGINIASCSNGVVSTTEEVRAMQLIGRPIRHYKIIVKIDGKEVEINKDESNIFLFYENEDKITKLIAKLEKYGLTEDCFEWGSKLVPERKGSTGNSAKVKGQLEKYHWEKISENRPFIERVKREIKERKTKEFNMTREHIKTLNTMFLCNNSKFKQESKQQFILLFREFRMNIDNMKKVEQIFSEMKKVFHDNKINVTF